MADRVRIGVIGTSGFTDFMHLTNLKSERRADVTAICGRNRQRAAELAAKHDIPLVFTDYREMLAKAPMDAVLVAVPDDLHFAVVMAALDAGLHVLCEKPLANDSSQARAMVEKAEASGRKQMVFFTWHWFAHYQQLQRLLLDGYVGQLRHCSLRYLSSHGCDPQYNWRWDGRRSNGVLGDLGSHLVHFAHLYVGEITGICANLHACVERRDEEGSPIPPSNDSALLALEFANGAHGTLQVSAVAHVANHFFEQQITLCGDAGAIHAEFSLAGSSLRGVRCDATEFTDFGSFKFSPDDNFGGIFDVFRTEPVGHRLFIDAVLEDKPLSPNFYEGLRVQRVLDAALTSHRERRWVTLAT